MIENYRTLEFVSEVLRLTVRYRTQPQSLRDLLRIKQKEFRSAIRYFETTEHLPCGYQDAAGDRCEQLGHDLMTMVHAYLSIKYSEFPKRLKTMIREELMNG